ncbi:MAG: FAD-binding oxidoreductase [Clostridiales bacterium]|jgi:glycine/D-amino acid oxidase-like deaminating enzyme|nr:FAD-binding oxidoreductase [Clostridiales bacterium]
MNQIDQNTPLWTSINAVPAIYPWLYQNEDCEVCVVGGGITGALCALQFAQAGVDTVLLAGGPVGYGGTSHSAGVLQADPAGGLQELSRRIGVDRAVKVVGQCFRAMDELEELAAACAASSGFTRRDSLSFVDSEDLADGINDEYLLKKHNGFPVELVSREQARDLYSFDLECGLLSRGTAATVDPYLLTHGALAAAEKAGARIYENTVVEDISQEGARRMLATSVRHTVTASTVVVAIGLDCCDFLKGSGSRRTCFAVATRPAESLSGWTDGCVIHHVGRPEITFSVTPQGRILASGLDTGLIDRNRRMAGFLPLDVLAGKKFAHLEEEVTRMFPGIRETQPEYAYTADFLQTEDGLPVIGAQENYPNCYFALCPSENGILFSQVAARLLLQLYRGEDGENADLYTPGRL